MSSSARIVHALSGAGTALLSALLFGITTPLAKELLGGANPVLIAGLLYVGSGAGLILWILVQDRGRVRLNFTRAEWPWLVAAVTAGGVIAPALLMVGLARTEAAAASLLLNLEMVFTALLAWLLFREPTAPRIVGGFVSILVGSLILVWPRQITTGNPPAAVLAIIAACLFWGIDNNLTRKISAGDARMIAALKGLVAGVTNIAIALVLGAAFPPARAVSETLVLGFLGYGVSLVLFVYSLRNLGAARTGAYFATAPFIGSALAIVLYGQTAGIGFWLAVLCMGVGVWLHLTEHHEHEHTHDVTVHRHSHTHDPHHRHEHDADWDGVEPHTHEHRHEPLKHSHPHFPDIHHRHVH